MIITAEEYRALYNPKEKQPCFICGKYKLICESHHVIPVKEIVKLINLYEYEGMIHIMRVWLCPNCHSLVHAMEKRNLSMDTRLEIYEYWTEQEREKYQELDRLKSSEYQKLGKALGF